MAFPETSGREAFLPLEITTAVHQGEKHTVKTEHGGERCTKTSFPKSCSCEWVIRFQPTKNLKGTVLFNISAERDTGLPELFISNKKKSPA